MEYHVHTLPNGIRILHVPSKSAISHACFLVKAGSRHEKPGKEGIAHFIEHMLFKKTAKRGTAQILNRLESVGADLNAYTTKEYTCIHASFLKPFLGRTLDLFADVVFHSTFPEDEFLKEKSIVLDEIASYQDQPEEAVYDDFEDMLFQDHPLGHNILGTEESVSTFTRADILEFIKENYDTSEMIIGVLGDYSFQKTVSEATKYFGDIPLAKTHGKEKLKVDQVVRRVEVERPISQAHVVLGCTTYDVYDQHKTGLLLLNNMLGGNGMSSILNLQIRGLS
ncbi:MAG: insulinase family protein [Chitinophagaceae bacterium]|nr:MAG: insulinase family protein [Chitinophagaceae bacterium]